MANIAQAIQQGTQQNMAQTAQLGQSMSDNAQQNRQSLSDTMAVEAHNIKKQAVYDEKAGGWMNTYAALKNNNSVAKGKAADNAKLMNSPDPKIAQTARAAMAGLEAGVTSTASQMGKFIQGTTGNPQMSEILKRSSYANDDLGKLLNGVLEDPNIPEEQKDIIRNNVALQQQVEQQLMETELAEQNAIAIEQARKKAEVQTRAQLETMYDVTGEYTKGQLAKAATAEDKLEKGKPGTQWVDMATTANIKGTSLEYIAPYLESAGSDVSAIGLLPGHFNAASDEVNNSMSLLSQKWGELVEAGGEKVGRFSGKYPNPAKMAPFIIKVQEEYKNLRATGELSEQAFKLYDTHMGVLGDISNEFVTSKDPTRKAYLSKAYGEYIRRTSKAFPSSPRPKLKAQTAGSDQS